MSSSSDETSDDDSSGHSGAVRSGEENDLDDVFQDAGHDVPPVPTPPIQQVRPRPRPRYRSGRDQTPDFEDCICRRVSKSSIEGGPVTVEVENQMEKAAENLRGTVDERRYPRRSNRTNVRFTQGIDG